VGGYDVPGTVIGHLVVWHCRRGSEGREEWLCRCLKMRPGGGPLGEGVLSRGVSMAVVVVCLLLVELLLLERLAEQGACGSAKGVPGSCRKAAWS
jgi:hypothetical protein